jgi:citrate synthase
MATLKGYRHGGAAERVLALVDEARTPKLARLALASRLRRGDELSGFGHPLYPAGDPRGAFLLRLAQTRGSEPQLRPFRYLLEAGLELLHDHPNLDFGLAVVTRTCGLANHCAPILFALGRTVGWIAHAMEQYASGQLIRPRARYSGPAPEDR